MMNFIRSIFGTASNFAGDPYGYITNQAGHFPLGFAFCAIGAWTCLAATNIYPDQRLVVAVVVIGYLFFWEYTVQGWRGIDTIEDVFYVGLGASPWLLIDMFYVVDRVFFFILLLAAMLGSGAYRRWARDE